MNKSIDYLGELDRKNKLNNRHDYYFKELHKETSDDSLSELINKLDKEKELMEAKNLERKFKKDILDSLNGFCEVWNQHTIVTYNTIMEHKSNYDKELNKLRKLRQSLLDR